MEVTNNTARGIIMGTHICPPGLTTEVPDSYSSNARVQELIAEGSMSEVVAPPPEEDMAGKREEARRAMERPGPSQPSDEQRPPAAQLPAQPARPPVTAAQQPAKPAVSPAPRPPQPRPEPKA